MTQGKWTEGAVFETSCPFHIYPVLDWDGECLEEKWGVGKRDHLDGSTADGHGVCKVHIIEVLPSKSGVDICVYERFYIDPDGNELTTKRRRRIGRISSVKALISRWDFKCINRAQALA